MVAVYDVQEFIKPVRCHILHLPVKLHQFSEYGSAASRKANSKTSGQYVLWMPPQETEGMFYPTIASGPYEGLAVRLTYVSVTDGNLAIFVSPEMFLIDAPIVTRLTILGKLYLLPIDITSFFWSRDRPFSPFSLIVYIDDWQSKKVLGRLGWWGK